MKSFEKIRTLRKQRGWSQLELSVKMGYNAKSTITRMEAGDFEIAEGKLQQYAEIFGIPVTLLLSDSSTLEEWMEAVQKSRTVSENQETVEAFSRFAETPEGREIVDRLLAFTPEEKSRVLEILKLLRP